MQIEHVLSLRDILESRSPEFLGVELPLADCVKVASASTSTRALGKHLVKIGPHDPRSYSLDISIRSLLTLDLSAAFAILPAQAFPIASPPSLNSFGVRRRAKVQIIFNTPCRIVIMGLD
jgi:hypothetical protein